MKTAATAPLHIGIVAGSAEGAALCYRTIVQEGATLLGEYDHPRITLDNLPQADLFAALSTGDLATCAKLLARSIETVAQAGASFAIAPENTIHIAVPFLGATSIPLLHIVEVVAQEAHDRKYERVGVLGTRMTMQSTMYADALGKHGVTAVIPSPEERTIVDDAIFHELVKGRLADGTRRAFQEIIDSLRKRGCDSVALACTEIPLLIAPGDSSLPTLDSTRLLATAALRRSLGLAHAV